MAKEFTVVGFDFGLKRIGCAVGQSVTKTASPLKTLQAKHGIPNWQEIAALIDHWQPQALIVGIPIKMDGSPQPPVTNAAKKFANELRKRFNLPVHEAEERLTTKAAKTKVFAQGGFKALQNMQIDSIAAKLILEEWFNNC